jgi:hypothetical protein
MTKRKLADDSLRELLTVSSTLTDAQVASHAENTCQTLLRRGRLSMRSLHFRFLELEFYCRSTLSPDPYAHATDHQLQPCLWYFHRAGKGGPGAGFRGGTRKGLDASPIIPISALTSS